MPISSPHSVTECLSDTVTRLSMGEEVEKLLSGALSNTPEQSLVPVSPRSPPPVVPNTPSASKEKAPSNLGEIIAFYPKQSPPSPHKSLQVGMANITAHSSHSPSPTLGTPDRNSTLNPPDSHTNSITLPEEMNNVMVHLLTFRASVDACQERLTSELGITHCQNDTEALEAINGVEAHYLVALCDTEAVYAAAMREAEATHLASTREVEATCATVVREAEVTRAAQTSKL